MLKGSFVPPGKSQGTNVFLSPFRSSASNTRPRALRPQAPQGSAPLRTPTSGFTTIHTKGSVSALASESDRSSLSKGFRSLITYRPGNGLQSYLTTNPTPPGIPVLGRVTHGYIGCVCGSREPEPQEGVETGPSMLGGKEATGVCERTVAGRTEEREVSTAQSCAEPGTQAQKTQTRSFPGKKYVGDSRSPAAWCV